MAVSSPLAVSRASSSMSSSLTSSRSVILNPRTFVCTGGLPLGCFEVSSVSTSTQSRRTVDLRSSFLQKNTQKLSPKRVLVKCRRVPGEVRAAAGGTAYWVTVFQSVGIAVATAASAVVAGMLFRYKLRKEAKKDIEQLVEECKQDNRPLPTTAEEFEEYKVKFQESTKAAPRKRPIREE